MLASLLGSYYMGELSEEEISQPDWYVHFKAVPLTGMNVQELLELRKSDPFLYNYWISKAMEVLRVEAEAVELIRYAKSREK